MIIRQRIHRKNSTGTAYDTIYFEGEAAITMRPNGESVEKALSDLESVTPRCASKLPEKLTPGQIIVVEEAAFIGSASGKPLRITGEFSVDNEDL